MHRFDDVSDSKNRDKYREVFCLGDLVATKMKRPPPLDIYKLVIPLEWNAYDSKYRITLLVPKDELLSTEVMFEKAKPSVFSPEIPDNADLTENLDHMESILDDINKNRFVERYTMNLPSTDPRYELIIDTLTLSHNTKNTIVINSDIATVWKYYCQTYESCDPKVYSTTFGVGVFINIVHARELLSKGKPIPGEKSVIPMMFSNYEHLCWRNHIPDIYMNIAQNAGLREFSIDAAMKKGFHAIAPTKVLKRYWSESATESKDMDSKMGGILQTELYDYQMHAILWMHRMEKNVFNRKIDLPSLLDLDLLNNSIRGKTDNEYIEKKIQDLVDEMAGRNAVRTQEQNIYASVSQGKLILGKREEFVTISGGMLCDEMGLGKSLIIFSLIHMKDAPEERDRHANAPEKIREGVVLPYTSSATLIIVPGHIVRQWKDQFATHFSNEYASDPSNKIITIATAQQLDDYKDSVTTPSKIFVDESSDEETDIPREDIVKNKGYGKKITYEMLCAAKVVIVSSGALNRNIHQGHYANGTHKILLNMIKWKRIVLDEGHEVLSVKTKTKSKKRCDDEENKKGNGILKLKDLMTIHSDYRWYVTGTPAPEKKDSLMLALQFLDFKISTHDNIMSTSPEDSWNFFNSYDDKSYFGPLRTLRKCYGVDRKIKHIEDKIFEWVMSFVFWRSTRDSVGLDRIIPKKVELTVTLDFSAIERKIYDDLNDAPFPSVQMLRKMCAHPQICEIYKNMKGSDGSPLTMEELRKMIMEVNQKTIGTLEVSINSLGESTTASQAVLASTLEDIEELSTRENKRAKKTPDQEHGFLSTKHIFPVRTDLGIDGKMIMRDDKKTQTSETLRKTVDSLMEKIDSDGKKMKKMTSELSSLVSRQKYFNDIVPILSGKEKVECPICSDKIEGIMSLGKCLHYFCTVCIGEWMKTSKTCPQCRHAISTDAKSTDRLIQININEQPKDDQSISMDKLKELYGTKMAHLIHHIKYVIPENEPESKVLVFSQWDEMLKLVSKTLNDNGIESLVIEGSTISKQSKLRKFQTSDKHKVILLSTNKCASGTNLTQANWIFLLDPIAASPTKARDIESQAIARSHRQGQKQEVKIVRLIIDDTIEKDIHQLQVDWDRLSIVAKDIRSGKEPSDLTLLREYAGITKDGTFNIDDYISSKITMRKDRRNVPNNRNHSGDASHYTVPEEIMEYIDNLSYAPESPQSPIMMDTVTYVPESPPTARSRAVVDDPIDSSSDEEISSSESSIGDLDSMSELDKLWDDINDDQKKRKRDWEDTTIYF